MATFDFFSVPRIVFGRGVVSRLGEIAGPMGKRALLVHNFGTPGDGGAVDRIADILGAANVQTNFFAQRGEPRVEDVDGALDAARCDGCDVIIGLGGGSAIDCAKAVAALLGNGGGALDYMEVIGKGRKITKPSVPWIAVPTTAGTGAEATRNAVIGSADKHFKASIRSEQMLARVALVDAELGVGAPPDVTARSGMDALCQVIESYTSTGAQPMTDALAVKGIELAGRSLRRAYTNGADVEAREEMAMAALLSGITLSNAGLGAVHGFAAPLGANFPVPHGAACAALLPHVIRANVHALREQSADHPVLKRYADVGRVLGAQALPDAAAIDACIEATANLSRDLHIPPLGQFGLSEKDIPGMVALAKKASSMRYNPVVLSEAALSETLRRAIVA